MPKQEYRVDGYDSFARESFPCGTFPTKEAAILYANAHGGVMTLMYVYGPDNKLIHKAGEY